MNVAHLKEILAEYPMSWRLTVVVRQHVVLETTVAEMLSKLMQVQPPALVTFCGFADCILREMISVVRNRNYDEPDIKRWLEMNMRGGDNG